MFILLHATCQFGSIMQRSYIICSKSTCTNIVPVLTSYVVSFVATTMQSATSALGGPAFATRTNCRTTWGVMPTRARWTVTSPVDTASTMPKYWTWSGRWGLTHGASRSQSTAAASKPKLRPVSHTATPSRTSALNTAGESGKLTVPGSTGNLFTLACSISCT